MSRGAGMAARAALAAIRLYQRRISPHKGFCCALRVGTGGASCSAYGHAAIARFGLRRGLGLLRRRLELCAHIHRKARPVPVPAAHPRLKRQGGFCHPTSCDLPADCKVADTLFDALDCADNVSDCLNCWPSRRGARPPDVSRSSEMDAAAERIRRNEARRREQRDGADRQDG